MKQIFETSFASNRLVLTTIYHSRTLEQIMKIELKCPLHSLKMTAPKHEIR